jgi:hypothetical protein
LRYSPRGAYEKGLDVTIGVVKEGDRSVCIESERCVEIVLVSELASIASESSLLDFGASR